MSDDNDPTPREAAQADFDRQDRNSDIPPTAERDKALADWMDGALQKDGYLAQEDHPTLMTCLVCGSTVHMGAVPLHDAWHDHLPGSLRNLKPGLISHPRDQGSAWKGDQ